MTVRESLILTKARLKGFKSIEDLSVTVEKGLNILIGKNASGKSNFLECLNSAISYRRQFEGIPFKYAKIDVYSSSNTFEWVLEETPQKLNVDKESHLDNSGFNEKVFLDSQLVFDSSLLTNEITYNNRKIKLRGVGQVFSLYKTHLPSPCFIMFNLPKESIVLDLPGNFILRLDIFNDLEKIEFPDAWDFIFTVFLRFENILFENDSIRNINKASILKQLIIKEKIISNLKKYTPIEDLRFNKNINIYKEDRKITIENIKLEFKLNGKWIPWSSLSDGTKRLFYMVAEISNKEHGLILVEEPELGIHPHQFHLVMEFLKEESTEKQIIISTHSPQALNYLNEDEFSHILIASYDSKKATQIRHMTNPEIKKAKTYIKEVGFMSDYWMLSDLES